MTEYSPPETAEQQADLPQEEGRFAALRNVLDSKFVQRGFTIAAIGAIAYGATEVGIYEYDSHHTVANHTQTLPAAQIPNILNTPSETVQPPSISPSSIAPTPSKSVTIETKKPPVAIPELQPHAPNRLIIPKLGINRPILPVSSEPTGNKNKWGGTEYKEIDFPVDKDARYWTAQGLPNTVKGATFETNPKAAMRTIIYGHASDIGNHLLFQDLQELKLGDTFSLDADGYQFTYTVYSLSNPGKDGLADDAKVYDIPKDGRKEVALVACLPDTASHSVRIGVLSKVVVIKKPAK